MKEIVQKENEVLRQKAKEVPVDKIKSDKIRKIIAEMKEALQAEADGVGLAAPQIGYSLKIFVIAPFVNRKNKKSEDPSLENTNTPLKDNTVFINPEIIKLSKEKKTVDEGCLSVRPLFGRIQRSLRAKIRAYDENGELFERGASGLLAQIFQHETDHLDGILFIDKATDLKEMVINDSPRREISNSK